MERTFFGGRKHDAKHAARKLAGQSFATTCLRQLERLEHAHSTKTKVLSKCARRACYAGKACRIPGYFTTKLYLPRKRLVRLTCFNVRINKKGGGTFSVRLSYFQSAGEYYYRTCEVRHTKTTHVTSTIKVRHKYLLRCIEHLYQS